MTTTGRSGGARAEPTGRRPAVDSGEADARASDAADPLTILRDRILLPVAPDGSEAMYLAGQSLGLQPRTA
jgi:kynureninase